MDTGQAVLVSPQATTIKGRISEIQPYEVLIFFVLLLLLTLCAFAAQKIVRDVRDSGSSSKKGLGIAFAWQ